MQSINSHTATAVFREKGFKTFSMMLSQLTYKLSKAPLPLVYAMNILAAGVEHN